MLYTGEAESLQEIPLSLILQGDPLKTATVAGKGSSIDHFAARAGRTFSKEPTTMIIGIDSASHLKHYPSHYKCQ